MPPCLDFRARLALFGLVNLFHQMISSRCYTPFIFPNSNNLYDNSRECCLLEDTASSCNGLTGPAQRTNPMWGQYLSNKVSLTAAIFTKAFIYLFIYLLFGTHLLSHLCQALQEAKELGANKTQSLLPKSSSLVENTEGKLIVKLHSRLHLNICRPAQRSQTETLISCI